MRRLCEAASGFVAIEVVNAAIADDLVVVAPTGYRVEGLDVETVVALPWKRGSLRRVWERGPVTRTLRLGH